MRTVKGLAEPQGAVPIAESGKVIRPGLHTTDRRPREHLLPREVEQLRRAARRSGRTERYARRNEALVMLMVEHGLRVSEAVALQWSQVEFGSSSSGAHLYVKRRKRGTPATHPLSGPEIRVLRQLQRAWPTSPYLFCSDRGDGIGPMTSSNVRKLIAHVGVLAKLPFSIHPHMLRHSTGYRLVNQRGANLRTIQQYLGHKNISHTVHYTTLSPEPFVGLEPAFKD